MWVNEGNERAWKARSDQVTGTWVFIIATLSRLVSDGERVHGIVKGLCHREEKTLRNTKPFMLSSFSLSPSSAIRLAFEAEEGRKGENDHHPTTSSPPLPCRVVPKVGGVCQWVRKPTAWRHERKGKQPLTSFSLLSFTAISLYLMNAVEKRDEWGYICKSWTDGRVTSFLFPDPFYTPSLCLHHSPNQRRVKA